MLDDADRHAQERVERTHPLGVALGQVVVDGDDVHAAAEQRVRVDGERRDERLALAGPHLGDLALVQHVTAHDLDVEVPHAQHAFARFADDGERLGEHVVERLAVREPLSELDGLRRQRGSSESAAIAGSSALVAATVRRSRATSRSLPSKIVLRKAILRV